MKKSDLKRNKERKSVRSHKSVSGNLAVHRDGYGFVSPDAGGDDVFIPARYLRENLHGDKVDVEVQQNNRLGKSEGRISKTLERGVKRITGIFSISRSGASLKPYEERLPVCFVPSGSFGGAVQGEVVVAEIVSYPKDRQAPFVRVVEILGKPDDPEVEILTVINKYELPYTFSPQVLKFAKSIPEKPSADDMQGRTDLRTITTITIDGETAKDFDDAVSIRKEGENFRLWVSIADVSHYVMPGALIDKEAYLRGTSVYFPDRCIPMLPEELSNGICSLNPNVDRLTLTAEMLFSKDGEMLASSFYPSIIKSAARLTYTIVSRIVEHDDAVVRAEYSWLTADLAIMQELASVLAVMRRERGSIDFDLPEAEIILDAGGSTEAIVRAERNQAHKIIESFMLAANEAVATYLTDHDIPLLYRIHEQPDQEKLAGFSEFLTPLGYELSVEERSIKPRDIQSLLAKAAGKPEERLVNRMLLRSMKQARYSDQNFGHFGLAAPCYTHFTSPIRRYPDLVVHRILKWLIAQQAETALRGKLKGSPFPGFPALLADFGEHTSKRERVAMEAERDIIELKKVQFMVSRVGEEFDGFITGVSAFGFFVELDELFVEGLVHISTLQRDNYVFSDSTQTLACQGGVSFRIGDHVRIVVASASPERRQIEFVLAGMVAVGAVKSDEYRRVPVKGKKPQGWKGGGKSDKLTGDGGKSPRRDGGGKGGRRGR